MKYQFATIAVLLSLLFFSCSKNNDPAPATIVENETLYYPPVSGTEWKTLSVTDAGWDQNKINELITLAANNNTRALLVLKDGKLVVEAYFGKELNGTTNFNVNSNWYWASAGKTLTASIVGLAIANGYLNNTDKTSDYLNIGWTSLSLPDEQKITVLNQLTMTSGLDDGVSNPDCTTPTCLQFKAAAGTRWAYHNAPYTLLDKVIENASGKNLNTYINETLELKIGLTGQFIQTNDNNVYYSNARSMARFGLLLLAKGKWNNKQIIDEAYFTSMTSTSQNINQAYGYLTWLNGKGSYRVPGLQTQFTGSIAPNAPTDMFAAIGKNGQYISVAPSENIVLIRMGDSPDQSPVPFLFQDQLWAILKEAIK
jgi:CubicO group peptidase (beta-lactamase class C family)